jgi:hypothetical protein
MFIKMFVFGSFLWHSTVLPFSGVMSIVTIHITTKTKAHNGTLILGHNEEAFLEQSRPVGCRSRFVGARHVSWFRRSCFSPL